MRRAKKLPPSFEHVTKCFLLRTRTTDGPLKTSELFWRFFVLIYTQVILMYKISTNAILLT
jgi:hypothetical protein